MYGVGEIPLNGKGMPLTRNGEGEEIVKTLYESIGCLIYIICINSEEQWIKFKNNYNNGIYRNIA